MEKLTAWAGRSWTAFRRWPNWAQVIGWLLGWWLLVPILAWRSAFPPTAKVAATLVVAVLIVAAAVSGGASSAPPPVEAEGLASAPPTPSASESSPAVVVETAKVPNVAGLPLAKARSRAESSGFQVAIDQKFSNKPRGTVLEIVPGAGTGLAVGSTVSFVIAKPFPKVPKVVGDKLKAARRALEARGFKVRVKKQVSTRPKDTVIAQTPVSGTRARPGRVVTLIVAKAAGGGGSCTSGYSPCLPLGPSDYDCYGGSGDGPAYTQPGVVYQVTGLDPYGLDANGNGLGCE